MRKILNLLDVNGFRILIKRDYSPNYCIFKKEYAILGVS
ncbi:hypothetical protein [Bacillus spizizenii]|nr:hypothetical protein [Bacillus spizizenii]MCY9373972.1 hypothetical protein [Bacillus sp. T17B1]